MAIQPEAQAAVTILCRQLLGQDQPGILYALASALAGLTDASLTSGILQALQALPHERGVDEAWRAWEETRHPDLAAWLVRRGQPAVYPPALRLCSLLKLGQTGALTGLPGREVPALVAAADHVDPQVAQRAAAALRNLQELEAREEVCRLVIEHDSPAARQAAVEAGYAPRQPQSRALFYLLTGQWERYEALDFDASLLRAVYATGDANLRTRLADLARRTGWAGFVQALQAENETHRLADLSAAEWEVTLSVLSRQQRWQDLWQLAQFAPPLWSARLLRDLVRAGWSPEHSPDLEGFQALADQAVQALAAGMPVYTWLEAGQKFAGPAPQAAALAISPDGRWLAAAGSDRLVHLWSLPEAEAHPSLAGHSSYIQALAFSPGSDLLASAGNDRSVRLWQLPGGGARQTLGGHAGTVTCLAFEPSGRSLASGDARAVHCWQMPTGRLLQQMPVEAALTGLCFTPDGQILLGSDEGLSIHLWPVPADLPGCQPRTLMERAGCLALRQDGLLFASASQYGKVRTWQLPEASLSSSLEGRADGRWLQFSPDGHFLAGSDWAAVRLWHLPAADPHGLIEPRAGAVTALAFSPRPHCLAVGGEERSFSLWQLPDGSGTPLQPISTCSGLSAAVRHLAFSPDGSLLVSADAGWLRLWALLDLGKIFTTPGPRTNEALERQIADLLHKDLADKERLWLEFSRSLAAWHRRYDIEIEETVTHIEIGEFDIELEL